ncbi:MAG: hypothetical protein HDS80_04910 [Bacteroidales bacterium]|nr:hypothetical protein [Bacteroidales bacterium]
MSIKSIANIINDTLNEYESPEEVEEIFCIGNLVHSESRKCDELMAEDAAILEEYGWQNDFALYFHEDRIQVRVYLRMAYVASCYLDGTWSEIKDRIPYIIPLLLAATELRKEKNIGMIWIDRQVTKLDWSKPESSMSD